MRRLILMTLLLAAAPLAVNAQTWPGWPGPPPPGYDPGAAIADQHRIEMDRLRNQAAEREALAQQQRLQTQLTIQQLQASTNTPMPPPATAPPPMPRRSSIPPPRRPPCQRMMSSPP